MTSIADTITESRPRAINPEKVYGLYDSSISGQKEICEAYMLEYGIPAANLTGVDLSDWNTVFATSLAWQNWFETFCNFIPADAEGVFCSPRCREQGLFGGSFARLLGHCKIIQKVMTANSGTKFTDLGLDAELLYEKIQKPEIASALRFVDDGTGNQDLSKSFNYIDSNAASFFVEGNYFGDPTNDPTYIPDSSLLPTTLEIQGQDVSNFKGVRFTYASMFGKNLFGVDFETFKTGENLDWDVIPSWRLGWYSGGAGSSTNSNFVITDTASRSSGVVTLTFTGTSGQYFTVGESVRVRGLLSFADDPNVEKVQIASIAGDLKSITYLNTGADESFTLNSNSQVAKYHAIPHFNTVNAINIARISKANKRPLHERLDDGIFFGLNDRGADAGTQLGGGIWAGLDAILIEKGFTNTKLGYSSANIGNDFDAATTGSVPEATGLSRYEITPVLSSAWVLQDETLLNGETTPIAVDAIYANVIPSNVGVNAEFNQFLTGSEDQVFEIGDGCVGASATSHGCVQGGWFLKAGGSAFWGSYIEPSADEESNSGANFFINMLRGHCAATAGMFISGKILSAEEVIGDGLSQAIYSERRVTNMRYATTAKPDHTMFDTSFGSTVGSTAVMGVWYSDADTGDPFSGLGYVATFGGHRTAAETPADSYTTSGLNHVGRNGFGAYILDDSDNIGFLYTPVAIGVAKTSASCLVINGTATNAALEVIPEGDTGVVVFLAGNQGAIAWPFGDIKVDGQNDLTSTISAADLSTGINCTAFGVEVTAFYSINSTVAEANLAFQGSISKSTEVIIEDFELVSGLAAGGSSSRKIPRFYRG